MLASLPFLLLYAYAVPCAICVQSKRKRPGICSLVVLLAEYSALCNLQRPSAISSPSTRSLSSNCCSCLEEAEILDAKDENALPHQSATLPIWRNYSNRPPLRRVAMIQVNCRTLTRQATLGPQVANRPLMTSLMSPRQIER